MTRLLVTGANGFLGAHTLPLLVEAGYEVHAASIDSPEYPAGVQAHRADLLSAGERRALLTAVRPSHLLHLAWQVPPGAFWTSPDNVRWLHASIDLLECFAEMGGRRWVGAGTCAEYDWSAGGVFRETDACHPATLYGACKSALCTVSQAMGTQLGVEVAWGRIFYPYGPGEPQGRLLPSVIGALMNGRTIPCTEGLQVRDFIYVGDIARAFTLLVGSSFKGAVNVASGTPITVREMVSRTATILGAPELIQYGALPSRSFEPSQVAADVSVLRSLGFGAPCPLEEGLQQTIQWWRDRQRALTRE